jgi:hypothetical protein
MHQRVRIAGETIKIQLIVTGVVLLDRVENAGRRLETAKSFSRFV